MSQYRFGLNFWNFFDLVHLNSEYLDEFPDFFSPWNTFRFTGQQKVAVGEFIAVGLTPDKRCGKPQQPSFPFLQWSGPGLFVGLHSSRSVYSWVDTWNDCRESEGGGNHGENIIVQVNGSNCRILEMAHGLALDHTDNKTVVLSIDWKSRQLKSCKLLWLEMIET